MEDYLTRRCYRVRNENMNALIYVEGTLDLGLYYICKRLIKLTKGVGYASDTDILYLNYNDLIAVDPIIWSKVYKILKMNDISCNTILRSCKECEFPTGYYASVFPTGPHYKLFEILENSQILIRFGDDKVWIKELKNDELNFEKLGIGKKWVSPETYNRVKNNVKDTIKQIDEIWKTLF